MKTQSARPASAVASTAITDVRRSVLRKVRQSRLDLALWERPLPQPLTALCATVVDRREAVSLDVTAVPGRPLRLALSRHAFFQKSRSRKTLDLLLEDFVSLATDFANVIECTAVRVRFDLVADDGCVVFHVDSLPARMLCTYAGGGTQWADESHIRRAELGLQGRTPRKANAAIVPDPAHIRTMPTGAVAIFKGRLWPGGESRGLVHRSHPVCCADHARLRLVIDPAGHAY